MGIRVINQMGPGAAAAIAGVYPEVEIIDFVAGDPPADLSADVFFGGYALSVDVIARWIEAAGVRWVQASGTGVDKFPREVFEGRIVTCARGASALPISEWVMAAVLAWAKRMPQTWLHEPPRHWNFPTPALDSVAGSTLALVGLGGIGSAVARRALVFDMEVVAMRRTDAPSPVDGVRIVQSMADLVAGADHLVLAAPATAKTRHLVDADVLAAAKPGLHIVNIARGALIDQDALRSALDNEQVAMATLDTVDPEPLPAGHWLYEHPKVRLSAHISWYEPELLRAALDIFVDNLGRFARGEQLLHVVDADEGYWSSVPGAAVVGTGFGARVHVPALRAAGFDVIALVGRDAERTARRAERLDVVDSRTSLADALAIPGVDAVTIAAPPDAHAALAIEACDAGRHVICEKPFALDVSEAEAMAAAATRAGVTALVGHEFRWAPDRALAARAIADGLIGEPRMATLVQYVPLVADPDAKVPDWWFDAARGGGWLGASGSHVVDQIRTWFGEVAGVSATLPTVANRTGAEDSFVIRMTMRNGAEVVIQQTAASWTPGVVGVTVVAGTDGTIEITGEGVWLSNCVGRELLPVPDDLELPAAPGASDDPRHRYTHLELGPYTRLCEVLRNGVEGRAPSQRVPVPTFADGLAATRVLDAVRVSLAAGGAVVAISA